MSAGYISHYSDTPAIHARYETFSGTLCFDIGANGGTLANLFARNFETVIAVEPADDPYSALESRAAPNVKPLHLAVSDIDGDVQFDIREMSAATGYAFSGNAPLPEWGDVISHVTYPAVTLDHLARLYGTPDFLKVDTEGHECEVLMGGFDTLDTHPAFLIEIHSEENGVLCERFLELHDLAYDRVMHEGRKRNLADHFWLVSP